MSSAVTSRIANECYEPPPVEFPTGGRWWEQLPENYYRLPDEFRVDGRTRAMIEGTALADLGVRTGLASLVATSAVPGFLVPGRMREDLEDRDFYAGFAERSSPHDFFTEPARVTEFREKPPEWYHFVPEDGESVSLTFESPFEPVNPRLRERYLSHRRNRVARAQYWRHNDGPRPTLVVVHGFVADPYWVNTRFLALPWFYKQGYDVLLYTMPFHGRRQDPWSLFSGQGFFSGGIGHINECFAQAIHDLRVFLRYLRERGAARIGATGISLGGYTVSLLSCIEEDLSFVAPNVPVVSLFDLVMSWFPVNLQMRGLMRAGGISLTDLRHATAVHSPLTWSSRLPRQRRMIIGGAGDRFAPPSQTWLLWRHWQECRLHWFPGNHLVHLDQGRYLREMRAFMDEIGF